MWATATIRVTAQLADLPADVWWIVLWQRMQALLGGRHADAEASSARAWELAEPARVPEAAQHRLIQTVFLRREQARLGELDPNIQAFLVQTPDSAAPTRRTGTAVASRTSRAR
jgi:hypothetical protein